MPPGGALLHVDRRAGNNYFLPMRPLMASKTSRWWSFERVGNSLVQCKFISGALSMLQMHFDLQLQQFVRKWYLLFMLLIISISMSLFHCTLQLGPGPVRSGRSVELLDVVLPFPQQGRFIREALERGLSVVSLGRMGGVLHIVFKLLRWEKNNNRNRT